MFLKPGGSCSLEAEETADSHSTNRTGYGAHGDYLFGWKDDALQRAMDGLGKGCHSEDCMSVLKIQSGKDAIACTKAQQAKEDVGNSKCEFLPSNCLAIILG